MAEPHIDLTEPRSVHLVGIGGAGISAIAVILAGMGHRVSGTDVTETGAWPRLIEVGVEPVVVAPDELFANDAARSADVLAHSTAFAPTAPERADLADHGVVVSDRAGILAAICGRGRTISVSGTHGKTSTTAMVATLLAGVGLDPSYLVGATPIGLGRAAHRGGGEHLVVEADESDGTFLRLPSDVAVVTNVDEDHLDFWGDLDAIEDGFARFAAQARRAVVCIDDPRSAEPRTDMRALRLATSCAAVTVGEAVEARFRIHDVAVDRLHTTFGLSVDGVEVGPVRIGTPGRHHARNAAVAIAVASELGVDAAHSVAAIAAYVGVTRRFEVVGEAGGVTVVDDYAHNPGKVRALVGSAVEAGWPRVVVIFQPHRYSRTKAQAADFGSALALADVVAVTDVYAAGEAPIEGVDGRTIVDAVLERRPWADVAWVPTLDDAAAWARTALRPGDLCLTVGAGDVAGLGPWLLEGRSPSVEP